MVGKFVLPWAWTVMRPADKKAGFIHASDRCGVVPRRGCRPSSTKVPTMLPA